MAQHQLFFIVFLSAFFVSKSIYSQAFYLPVDYQNNFIYEESAYYNSEFHTAFKPFLVSKYIFKVNIDNQIDSINENSSIDFYNKDFFYNRNYNSLRVNPVYSFLTGVASNPKKMLIDSDLGLHIEYSYKKNFAIEADIIASYSRFDKEISKLVDSTTIIPHYGKFINSFLGGYLYEKSNFYLSWTPSQYINFHLGRGRNFIGDGYRSLLLSSNTNNYPFFKLNTFFWKVNYQWIFTRQADLDLLKGSKKLHPEYAIFHAISWNVSKNININLFESVVWNSVDSVGNKGIELTYLNPVMFYRPVEFAMGSPDNVILGLGFKTKLLKHYFVYGQFVIDEFLLKEIKANTGWWGNKYGYQFGIKSYNVFNINNLYLLLEYNKVLPFTFAHFSPYQNYGSYLQAFGHPAGANFKEYVCLLKYYKTRWFFELSCNILNYGGDPENSDFSVGKNIYLPYDLRQSDYGNKFLQGEKSLFVFNELKISYLLNRKNKYCLDFSLINKYRNTQTAKNNLLFILGFRTGLHNLKIDFE